MFESVVMVVGEAIYIHVLWFGSILETIIHGVLRLLMR